MRNIAIIPARSGSKGLKDKNIRLLNGMPMIGYTIKAAIDSECFDEILVSTDSERYAEIARELGANVPFLRSPATSSDSATSWETVSEVLDNYNKAGHCFESFCLLQPTSPLRNASDIKQAFQLYREKAAFAVVSVCENEHSPLWSGRLPNNHEFIDFITRENIVRRQQGGVFYRLNGAIYFVNCERFQRDQFLYQKGSFAYIMPQCRSIDVDSEMDFAFAEFLLEHCFGVLE